MAYISASSVPAHDRLSVLLVEPGALSGAYAALLAAYRFIADNRDQATEERLDYLEDPYRLFRCHGIMNCVEAVPKA